MKKYVSAILLDILFIQLCGCYTLRDYTYDEFRDMNDVTEVTINCGINSKFNLIRDSLYGEYMNWDSLHVEYVNWVAETDTLRIYSTYSDYSPPNDSKTISDSLILTKSQIYKVQINEVNAGKTVIAILVPILVVSAIVAVVIKESMNDWDWNFQQ
jgi:hypothetical protein